MKSFNIQYLDCQNKKNINVALGSIVLLDYVRSFVRPSFRLISCPVNTWICK